MNAVTLLQPPRIVVGNGCAVECVNLLAQRGFQRVLLVTSTSVLQAIESVKSAFCRQNITLILSRLVDCEPTCELFAEILMEAKSQQIEAVLGVGGGSAMDVAKLVAALLNSNQRVQDVFGINLLQGRSRFLVCVPTTAGTGSEVSPNAILLDTEDHLKKGVVSPHLVPDAAYIDPQMTLSVPPSVTAATGLDALTHCIEAYANKFAHPAVDIFALEGIKLISRNLLSVVEDGANVPARADVALGSLYGGLCLGPVNTAAVHALSYPLGGQFKVAHGISNAVLLPHVLRFNLPFAPEKYAEIARSLGVRESCSATEVAEHGIEQIVTLSRRCGIPQQLRELNIPRSAIPGLAESAMNVTRLLKNNLRPLTKEDAIRIYEDCF